MRGVRYGLVRHGLLLLPSEVIGDLSFFCSTNVNPSSLRHRVWSEDDNMNKTTTVVYPAISLIDTMLSTVRMADGEDSNNHVQAVTSQEPQEAPSIAPNLLSRMTPTLPIPKDLVQSRRRSAPMLSSSASAEIRIVLFAVLQGISRPFRSSIRVRFVIVHM